MSKIPLARRLLPALVLFAAACAPEPSEVTPDLDTSSESGEAAFTDVAPPGTEQFVITSTDGAIDLGLTDRVVFFRLSPTKRVEIEEEMAAEVEGVEGRLGGFIAETVTGAVGGLLDEAVHLPVQDVRVVHDGAGRLDIESTEGGAASVRMGSDDEAPAFDPADAERFVEAFERVRAGR